MRHRGRFDSATGHAQEKTREHLFQSGFVAADQNLQVLSGRRTPNRPVGKAHRLFAPHKLWAELELEFAVLQ